MVWELIMEQPPDLLKQERDHGRGPVLARLLALLERGCRLHLEQNHNQESQESQEGQGSTELRPGIVAWAQSVVDDCLRLKARSAHRFRALWWI